MKLPSNVRKMSVSEFCEVYHADINSVVNAEEIKAANQVKGMSRATPATASKRSRPRKTAAALDQPFNLDMLQGKGVEEQLAFLNQWKSQLDAFSSQLKVAK